ncbi:hypothetical protein ABFT80_23135 [Mesorhizobium sp. SB112]|uniref:ATP dependent DNA ligase n=1 Tax=Mesorhizobium sp. SB112 TaxID=3151853 RepID=UPI00326552C4
MGAYAKTNGKFRSLLAGVNRGDHFVYVGRVGTGYGAKVIDTILPKLCEIETSKSPFTGIGAPKKDPNIVWVKPVLVSEIQFAGWTANGLVRQAAFKGLREDKPAEKPTSPSSPRGTRSGDRGEGTCDSNFEILQEGCKANVMGVLISSPENRFGQTRRTTSS